MIFVVVVLNEGVVWVKQMMHLCLIDRCIL